MKRTCVQNHFKYQCSNAIEYLNSAFDWLNEYVPEHINYDSGYMTGCLKIDDELSISVSTIQPDRFVVNVSNNFKISINPLRCNFEIILADDTAVGFRIYDYKDKTISLWYEFEGE